MSGYFFPRLLYLLDDDDYSGHGQIVWFLFFGGFLSVSLLCVRNSMRSHFAYFWPLSNHKSNHNARDQISILVLLLLLHILRVPGCIFIGFTLLVLRSVISLFRFLFYLLQIPFLSSSWYHRNSPLESIVSMLFTNTNSIVNHYYFVIHRFSTAGHCFLFFIQANKSRKDKSR